MVKPDKKNLLYLPQYYEQGRLAEWLGRGLQNLVQRFESAIDLKTVKPFHVVEGLFVLWYNKLA